MKQNETIIIPVKTLVQQHQLVGVAKPKHPLFSILRFEDFTTVENNEWVKLISEFFQITLKNDCPCKLKYGQTQYDFDEGIMSFFAPKQVNTIEPGDWVPSSGWLLSVHPDFLRSFSIGQKIRSYNFFDYDLNEALILSEDEQKSIGHIFEQIEKEYLLPVDKFSQEVVISNLELLLTYCNRYYDRQFIIRKLKSNELLSSAKKILDEYFTNTAANKGLPTAAFLASQVNLSPKYLSDCLKQLTGLTSQQLIHETLIEYAKDMLTTTELSISEIAFNLGFEHSQSFSKLFKNKTDLSPLAFRQSFN
jgi:AraC family transcriptional activator of pobA